MFYVYRTEENGIEGQTECEAEGFEWRNAEWNFDHIGSALQSVLVIFTYNGWQDILFHAINARRDVKRGRPLRHCARRVVVRCLLDQEARVLGEIDSEKS